ncbi:MAG: hypothetical protein BWY17_04507 [Deltaproteobacteria bacterium ADurb.Bin207]|nr:MAG: hypothetical protein BWY17_04507 [Deltaproteobacteria bacterium ADurb.Bin207]
MGQRGLEPRTDGLKGDGDGFLTQPDDMNSRRIRSDAMVRTIAESRPDPVRHMPRTMPRHIATSAPHAATWQALTRGLRAVVALARADLGAEAASVAEGLLRLLEQGEGSE